MTPSLHFLFFLFPSFSFSFFALTSLVLEVRPLESSKDLQKRCRLPDGLWGEAPVEFEFGAFWL